MHATSFICAVSMAIIDKVQGAVDKVTKNDTKVTAAELVTLQQAHWAAQLAFIKNSFYIRQAQNEDVRSVLGEINEEYIRPGLDKTRRVLERSNVPMVDLDWQSRAGGQANAGSGQLNDQEIVLDAMYNLQASITAAQAGALAAVRGDVRDIFLTQRDQGMDLWRKLALVVHKTVPNAIPPQVEVTGPAQI